MELTAKNVETIFVDCLFREGEDTTNHIAAHGVIHTFGFMPERVESHKDEIISLLHELPDTFQRDGGGGGSFLAACVDKEGVQWGEHLNMEQLFCLGMAIDAVEEPFPKECRAMLPGGMPYYAVVV